MATSTLSIGSIMPEFELKGTDEKIYSDESFKDSKGLVVIFSCNHCPYVKAYEDRIIKLQNEYSGRIQIVVVNSNDDANYPEDSFEQMKIRVADKNFNFPYLRDETQKTAKEFGATHTPEIFLFDQERKLIFHGKIDDNWKEPDAVKVEYLKNAIEQLLNDEVVVVAQTFTIGCTIKWK